MRPFSPLMKPLGWRHKQAKYPNQPFWGRKKGQPVRLTTNEWYKATQLGESYWLYVVWDPLDNPEALPIRIQNPAKKLDHVKREIVSIRFFEIPAAAMESHG